MHQSPAYSPMAKWAPIRTVLAFALQHNLDTKQIDFSNAFVQAELPQNMEKYTDISNAEGLGNKGYTHICM